MKKYIYKIICITIIIYCCSCSDKDSPISINTSQQSSDSLVVSELIMHNSEYGKTILGGFYIDSNNDFCAVADGIIVTVNHVNELNDISYIPIDGWNDKMYVSKGCGYIIYDIKTKTFTKIYVKDYIINANNQVVGAVVQYETPFNGTEDTIELKENNKSITFDYQGGDSEITFANRYVIPFCVSVSKEWCSVKTDIYYENEYLFNRIKIIVNENESLREDSCIVTLKNSKGEETIIIVHRNGSPSLVTLIAGDKSISLFYEALCLTHMKDSLYDYEISMSSSIDATNYNRCCYNGNGYDNVFYNEKRYRGYTAFIEPDEVYAAHEIQNIDDLRAYAKEVYDDMYPEDADVTDETDRRNSLNRFVSYHFLDRRAHYDDLTVKTAGLNCFDRRHWDVADWYETMMPHSLMKISYPSGTQAGRYVNRRGVQNRKDTRGVFVPGARILSPSEAGINQEAVNGVYHYITDIITYGRDTQEKVFNDNMIIDATTLSPDFMTSGARGHKVGQFGVGGIGGSPQFPYQYGVYSTSTDPSINPNTCLGFTSSTAGNFIFNDNQTQLYVQNRRLNQLLYQGDALVLIGQYDVTIQLPTITKGEYEIRMAANWSLSGNVNIYIDDKLCSTWSKEKYETALSSFINDSDLVDLSKVENSRYNDNEQLLYSLGWVKGLAFYGSIEEDGSGRKNILRNYPECMRMIIGHLTSDGKNRHKIRIVNTDANTDEPIHVFDYLELCPIDMIFNESKVYFDILSGTEIETKAR